MPRLFCLLLYCLLAGCSGKATFDPRSVESDAGEALLRKVFADCPHAAQVKAACIVLGPAQEAASTDFLKRLENLGPRLLSHKEVTITSLNGKVRVHEKPRGNEPVNLVLLLQIAELSGKGAERTAVAAWAYKDEMIRREYALRLENGSWTAAGGRILEQKSGETK